MVFILARAKGREKSQSRDSELSFATRHTKLKQNPKLLRVVEVHFGAGGLFVYFGVKGKEEAGEK